MLLGRAAMLVFASAVLGLGPAGAIAADYGGGGSGSRPRRPERECLIGLEGTGGIMTGGTSIECTDCDPGCDADGVPSANGACAFRVRVCLNYPNLSGCEPGVLGTAKAKPRRLFPAGAQLPAPPADDGMVCGVFTEGLVVGTRRRGTRPGKRRITLQARSLGTPPARDRDVFTLVCNPLPAGQSCQTSAVSTTSTTTPPATIPIAPAPPCTETMDATCPDLMPGCGATFSGGTGCRFEGKTGCYESGIQSYRVDPDTPLTITLDPGIVGLEVFFAAEGTATATMVFRDASGASVGSPLGTNGNCLASMPSTQRVSFSRPVRTIEVSGMGGTVWLDTFRINR